MPMPSFSQELFWIARYLSPVFGLILGSFYTALASRIIYYYYGPGRKIRGWLVPRLLSKRWAAILTRPSFCFSCQQEIRGMALWPVLGYLILRGRCRHCKTPFSWIHLCGEVYMGILLPLLLWHGASWTLALLSASFAGLLYISIATDSLYYQLDHENATVLALLAIACVALESRFDWNWMAPHVYAGAGGFFLFLILHLFYKKGLGFADVPFVAIIGFFLGLPWFLFCLQIAGLFAIAWIYLVLKDPRAPAPLGTGLALGCLFLLPLSYLWDWY